MTQSLKSIAALSMLLAGATWAQSPAETPSEEGTGSREVYFDRVDVNVVNIDVYVKVSNFYAVEGGAPVSEPIGTPGVTEGTRDDPRAALAAVPEDQRLHLIIYFDNSFMKPFQSIQGLPEVGLV